MVEPFELTVPEDDFDWSSKPTRLRDAYLKSNFDKYFLDLTTKDVIKILSPQLIQEPHNLVYDDDIIYEHLIGPLERFVCNLSNDSSDEEIKKTLNYLESLNEPRKLCRRVLKSGDVTFQCNDCGLDATCVVCIDCFHKGPHKNHNYRMSNSDGGGCCDCGDIEAWKQNHACSEHTDPEQANTISDFQDGALREKLVEEDKKSILKKIARIPNAIALRYFLACQASLQYAILLLSWRNHDSLPYDLESRIETMVVSDPELEPLLVRDDVSENYFTVLFNDEVHTYDHVINTLVKVISCSKLTASIMASTVSREGRSLVFRGNKRSCDRVKDSIGRDTGNLPLKVLTIHNRVLAFEAFAIKLIEWVEKMSSLCDAFRILTAYTLLGQPNGQVSANVMSPKLERSVIENIMLSNTKYWKIVRIQWNDLIVKTMLTDYSIKEQFARLITRLYPRLMDFFIKDDHDHSVSILTLTTQVYTVISLICMLIEEENALSLLVDTLQNFSQVPDRDAHSNSYEHRYTLDMYGKKRSYYIIMDIKYLISIEPTKWTPKLRRNVFEAVRKFIDILSSMQGMDPFRRQLGQHIEYDAEYYGLSVQQRFTNLISRFVHYCSLDEEVLLKTLTLTQEKLLETVPGGFKKVTNELFGHSASCISYDVSISHVSLHLPLTRFAAALIIELMKRRPCERIPYDESLVILTNNYTTQDPSDSSSSNLHTKNSMINIMEPSLRTEVMIAQFRSGMWRRNGYSLINQIIYFHGAYMRREMFDRDILVLQECAAMVEPNEFMIHLLNKFQLFPWINHETATEMGVGSKAVNFQNDEDMLSQTMSMGEEFLQLLLTIISERHRPGIGKSITDIDVIKNEVIQLLCIGSATRSDLFQKLMVNDNELECIKDIAHLRRSNESSTGRYELKDEYYESFNPFFYHYSRRQQSNALDAQLKRKKMMKDPLVCCPPPRPVELTEQFKNLNELLKCDITLILISKILTRAIGPAEVTEENSTRRSSASLSFFASDLQLDQCLHLIGIGLHEQEKYLVNFNYLKAVHDKGIFKLLRECYEKAKRSKDLILWLIKKTNAITENLLNNPDQLDEFTRSTIESIREEFSSILSSCDTSLQDNKKKNSELASKRRERIMAMMKANQEKFLSTSDAKQLVIETEKNNPQPKVTTPPTSSSSNSRFYTTRCGRKIVPPKSFYSSVEPSTVQTTPSNNDDEQPMECDINLAEESDYQDIVMNPTSFDNSHLCILCRDEQSVGLDKPTMVLMTYIQRSAVLSKNRKERRIPYYSLTPTNQLKHQFYSQPSARRSRSSTTSGLLSSSPSGMSGSSLASTQASTAGSSDMYSFTSDNSWSFDATFMPSDLFFGPHISSCGHVMHYDCWRGFFNATSKRESNRNNRNNRHVSFELEKNEILCPLCEFITNAVVPLVGAPIYQKHQDADKINSIFSAAANNVSDNMSACLHALRGAVDMFKHIRHIKDVSTHVSIDEDKYIKLLRPRGLNDVLEELEEVEALGLRDFINTMRSNKIVSTNCNKDILSCIQAYAERIHIVGLDLDNSISGTNHARIFMMTTWSISYTVQASERLARFKGVPLFEDLESNRILCLNSLIRFACASMMTHQSDMLQSLLVRKLRYLLINEEHLSSSPCCLDIDAFETLVSLVILLQKLYFHIEDPNQLESGNDSDMDVDNKSSGKSSIKLSKARERSSGSNLAYGWTTTAFNHEYFRNIIHLMFILDSMQVIISMHNESQSLFESSGSSSCSLSDQAEQSAGNLDDSKRSKFDNEEHEVFYNYYKEMVLASGHPNNRMPKIDEKFCADFKQRLLPFLRSCAIFFFHLSQVTPPSALSKASAFIDGKDLVPGKELNSESIININNEFSAIAHYLGLSDKFKLLFQNQEVRHLARSWLRHSRVLLLIKSDQEKQTEPLKEATLPRKASSSSLTSAATSQEEQRTELMPVRYVRQPHLVNRLIELPYDYSELVDKVSDFSCPSIKNEDSKSPTMCLVCGVILCSQSYCCQRDLNNLASNYKQVLQRQQQQQPQHNASSTSGSPDARQRINTRNTPGGGHFDDLMPAINYAMNFIQATMGSPTGPFISSGAAGVGASSNANNPSIISQQLVGSCTYHAHECSGGVGVFLRLRTCQILLMSGRSKGCYISAPYIDDHGEADYGLLRGNPLYLNRQHYEKLQQKWLSHSIPEEVSRTLENSPYASGINWHLH